MVKIQSRACKKRARKNKNEFKKEPCPEGSVLWLQRVSKETGKAEEEKSRVKGTKKSEEVHKIESFEAIGGGS